MRFYVAEAYLARASGYELGSLVERVRSAAEAVRRTGVYVRHLETVFLAGDETCLHFFEASSVRAVMTAGKSADVAFDRVSEASYLSATSKDQGFPRRGRQGTRTSIEASE
jgi:hypothetical protein